MTWSDLLRDALLEIAAVDPIDPVPAELQSLALIRLNSLINQKNAQQITTYGVAFPTFTLTPLLSPHTIGPSGVLVVTARPVAIIGANLRIGSGTTLARLPIDIRDAAWWLDQAMPNIRSGVPTDLYYADDWPNGSLYLWPVPTVAYGLELEVNALLSELTEADLGNTIALPQGYQRDYTLSLAEDLTGPLTVPMPSDLSRKASQARAITEGNNNAPVRIVTRQSGMPGGDSASGGFNWQTGRGGGR